MARSKAAPPEPAMTGFPPVTAVAQPEPPPSTGGTGRAPRIILARHHRIDGRRRWFPDLREVARFRDLLVVMSKRQITITYRQTVLGAIWVLISPLLSAGLFTFVFGSVAHLSSGGVPYFAFSYAGLLGWTAFSSTLTNASASLTSNSTLISKIYFPRLILPFSTVVSTLIQLGVSSAIMLLMVAAYGIGFSVNLLLLPIWLMLAILLGLGGGLIMTAVSVSYRDINNVAPALVSMLLYLTPVAYSTSDVPSSVRHLFLINPVASLVEGCRWSVLGGGDLTAWSVCYSIAATVGLLMAGLVIFARLERTFADVI
jgi:lipopolysaccharide transport system permease protein